MFQLVTQKEYDKLLEEKKELTGMVNALQAELRSAVVDAEQWKAQSKRLSIQLDRAEALLKHYRGGLDIGGDINLS